MIATIVKHQWFSGSPLPLNEWFGRNHWYQWFFNGFWSINHWPRWFFSLATIGLDGFAMVFGLATIGLDGFSMVANHWSNDGMVTIHRYGLLIDIDIFRMALSISIFSKFADISTIDINIRYSIHKSGEKHQNRLKTGKNDQILHPFCTIIISIFL